MFAHPQLNTICTYRNTHMKFMYTYRYGVQKKNIIKSQVCWCKHILEMSYTGWVGYDGNIGICVHILQWLLSSENSKTYFTYSLNLCVCIPPATDDSFRFSSVPVTANDLMRRMKCGKWNFFSLCRLPKKNHVRELGLIMRLHGGFFGEEKDEEIASELRKYGIWSSRFIKFPVMRLLNRLWFGFFVEM